MPYSATRLVGKCCQRRHLLGQRKVVHRLKNQRVATLSASGVCRFGGIAHSMKSAAAFAPPQPRPEGAVLEAPVEVAAANLNLAAHQ
jgi:hypothetical protein